MAKAKVNKEACIGCGLCVGLVPSVFIFDDSGEKADVVVDVVPADVENEVNEAAAGCPVEAIIVK